MPPILLCWPTTSEVDIGGMTVEVEPAQQYSITLCCCVTDHSRRAGSQNSVCQRSSDEAKVCHLIPPFQKNQLEYQSVHCMGAMNAYRGTERPPYVSLSGPTELI